MSTTMVSIAFLSGIVVFIAALIWLIINKIRYESPKAPLITLLAALVFTSAAAFGAYKADFPSETALSLSDAKAIIQDASMWEIIELKDEFGDASGFFALMGGGVGRFSNSATSNAVLFALCRVDANGDRFILNPRKNYRCTTVSP
jgi:hypothetical protein